MYVLYLSTIHTCKEYEWIYKKEALLYYGTVVILNTLHRRSNSYLGSVLIFLFLFLTVLLFISSTYMSYCFYLHVL